MQHLLNLINLNLLYKCEFQFLNKIQITEIRITRIQGNIKFFLNAFHQFRKHCISDTSIRQNSSDSSSTGLIVIPNRIDNVNENQSAA